jgi:hypothetical protein
MTPDTYPTPEEIAEWELEILDAPPTVTRPWTYCDPDIGCDYCGCTPVAPLTGAGWIYDGDPAVCLGCGSVFSWAVDSESSPHLQSPHAILSPDALARLRGELEVSP